MRSGSAAKPPKKASYCATPMLRPDVEALRDAEEDPGHRAAEERRAEPHVACSAGTSRGT